MLIKTVHDHKILGVYND